MRTKALLNDLQNEGIDAYWCVNATNRRYLSGFTGSAGALLIHPDQKLLFIDSRYTLQAKQQAPGFTVVECGPGALETRIAEICAGLRVGRLGFEEDDVTVSDYERMQKALGAGVALVHAGEAVRRLRAVKSPDELEKIREAARIADQVFEHIFRFIKEGMREKDVALEIEYQIKKRCDGVSFDTIAASGPNSALPHAQPGERRLKKGDALVMDFGAVHQGYCSDFSRTIFIGPIDKAMQTVYNTVWKAQEAALNGIRAGMPCRDADALARGVIKAAGYGEAFGHGLGHGVGMDIHEAPRVSCASDETLTEGMVVTVEPGIYVPGLGGVRIEDLVVVQKDGVQILTAATKACLQI